MARQLGPSNYGIFTLVLWFTGTITWVLGMGLVHAVTKFIAEAKGRNEPNQTAIVLFVLKIELALTLVSTVILVYFRAPISDYFFSPTESFFFLIAFLGLVPGIVTAVFSSAIEGVQKFEYFTYSNLIITPFSFASKLVVLWMGKGINGILVVMLVFSFINTLFYLGVLRKEGFFKKQVTRVLEPTLRKRILKYNASVFSILLCDKVVWDRSENFFLGRFCAASEIAYYNLGFNIAQRFMTILPSTFWRVLFPAMSTYFGSGDREKMRRLFYIATRYLAFVSFPVGTAGAILAYQIIHFLYGHEFIGAQRTLQIIFVSSIFSSLSKPASAILYGFERQSFIFKYGSFLAVLNIIVNLLLIPRFGSVGAAIGYGSITFLGSVGGLLYTCRIMHLHYPFVSLFKILFSTIIMGIVMEVAVLRFPGLVGFVLAAVSGLIVYMVGSLVLGTFEKEDYTLMESAAAVLPGQTKKIVTFLISFIEEFKRDSTLPAEKQ